MINSPTPAHTLTHQSDNEFIPEFGDKVLNLHPSYKNEKRKYTWQRYISFFFFFQKIYYLSLAGPSSSKKRYLHEHFLFPSGSLKTSLYSFSSIFFPKAVKFRTYKILSSYSMQIQRVTHMNSSFKRSNTLKCQPLLLTVAMRLSKHLPLVRPHGQGITFNEAYCLFLKAQHC